MEKTLYLGFSSDRHLQNIRRSFFLDISNKDPQGTTLSHIQMRLLLTYTEYDVKMQFDTQLKKTHLFFQNSNFTAIKTVKEGQKAKTMKLRLHSQSGRKQYHYYQTSGAKDILGLAQTTTTTIFFSGRGFNCFSVSAQWDIPRHPQPFPTIFLFPISLPNYFQQRQLLSGKREKLVGFIPIRRALD